MDFMELLELVQSLALMFAGAALLGLVLKTERVNENARNTAIAQRGTESYATKRFAEVKGDIDRLYAAAGKMHRILGNFAEQRVADNDTKTVLIWKLNSCCDALDRFTDDGR